MQLDGQTQPTASSDQSINTLSQQLEAEQIKSAEYFDLLRRTQADFVNYRRRSQQEQSEGRTAGQVAVLTQLLPVVDDFGRALESTPPELADQPWTLGIILIAKRLNSLLEQMGVRQFARPGEQFDPRLHEAIMQEHRPGTPEGTILQVIRPGYQLDERVIRTAQVVVAADDPV